MKVLRVVTLILAGACMTACVAVRETAADGSSATYVSLGGRAAWRKGVGLIHQHERSFRDGMFAVSAVSGTMSNTAIAKAGEETARVSAQEATKRHAAEQVTRQTTITAREAVTKTALQVEQVVPVTPP